MSRAIEYFMEVIDRDPDFAPAHATLAQAYLTLPFYDLSVPILKAAELARAAALKALALDPELGEAYAALGYASVLSWEWDTAEGHFIRALELTPGNAGVYHWYGGSVGAERRHGEAIQFLRRALELDPFSPRMHQDLAGWLHWGGEGAEAADVMDRGLELDPGYSDFYLWSLRVYVSVGRDDSALDMLIRSQQFAGAGGVPSGHLQDAFQSGGIRGALRLVLDRAPESLGESFVRAGMEVLVGDTEAALRSLERAVDEHEAYSPWIGADPLLLGALGDEPRYRALLQRVGLSLP